MLFYGIIAYSKQRKKRVFEMIRFVIVEDNSQIQEKIKKLLRKISIGTNQDYEVKYFERYTKDLQKEIDDQTFRKVYIMDIELDGSISGIEIAQKIRENDWDSEIIFVTSHDKMFETVHRNILEVFDFIEKFLDMENRLEEDILKIINKKYDKKILKITGNNVELELHMKNILYIVKEDKKSVIRAFESNEFKTSLTLEKLLELLDDRFIRTHKSCIANKDRIVEKNYAKGYFILDTGEKVDLLSKKYKKVLDK